MIIPGQIVSVDPITQRVGFLVGFSNDPAENTLTNGDYGATFVDAGGKYLGNVTDYLTDDSGKITKLTGTQIEEAYGLDLPPSYLPRTFVIATAKLVTADDVTSMEGNFVPCQTKTHKVVVVPARTSPSSLPRLQDIPSS